MGTMTITHSYRTHIGPCVSPMIYHCSDVLWTYLTKFQKPMLRTLFARTANKKNLTDAHLNAICPGGPDLLSARLRIKVGVDSAHVPEEFYSYNMSFSQYVDGGLERASS